MSLSRPKINVPMESFDYVIELISITLLILTWCYCIYTYSDLPEQIPTHFNGAGEPDNYSNKNMVWLLPAIGTLLYFGLFTLTKYPHLHNYMINIDNSNAIKNYRFSIRTLRIVNVLCTVLFAYITYIIVQSAFNNEANLGRWFIPIVIGCSIILPIILAVYQKKMNKKNTNG